MKNKEIIASVVLLVVCEIRVLKRVYIAVNLVYKLGKEHFKEQQKTSSEVEKVHIIILVF